MLHSAATVSYGLAAPFFAIKAAVNGNFYSLFAIDR